MIGCAGPDWPGWIEEVTQYFEQYETPQYKSGQEVELMEYLNGYQWQAWLHATAEPGTTFERIDKMVGAWRGRLAHRASLQVSTMGVCTLHPQPHAHVLLVGRNKHGKTIADLSEDLIDEMEGFWKSIAKRSAVLELLNDNAGAIRYIVENNTINKQSTILSPRGIKLLTKLKSNQKGNIQ